MAPPRICGLVLAAGAGARFGGPKALARSSDGTPWINTAIGMLRAGGCSHVIVALGAEAARARPLVPREADVLIVPDWAEGLGATLRAALVAGAGSGADQIVVTPVDTPDAPAEAIRRVVAAANTEGSDPRRILVQAVYDARPGHPVLIGADRVPELLPELRGDRGARAALVGRGVIEIECSDLWSGADVDIRPAAD